MMHKKCMKKVLTIFVFFATLFTIVVHVNASPNLATTTLINKYSSMYVTYFKSPIEDKAWVDVFTLNTSPVSISKYLFGIFIENLGQIIAGRLIGTMHHGIWAEILDNPSFESAKYFGSAALLYLLKNETIAFAWTPYGSGNVSYSLVNGYCSGTAQKIVIHSLNTKRVGIAQGIYVPIHKINKYVVKMYLRGNISRVIISLEKENGMILDKHVIEDVNGEWKEYEFNLSIPQGSINVGERIRFAITSDVPGWFEVDHASLMPADNIYGFDPDVIRLMKEAGITLIRWPGGNFASQYHWKDGIGPMVCRPTRLNMAWNIPEFNYVGTDEFMKFAELVGAEPLLAVNAGWNGTVEEAAEWVEYVNGNPNTTKWGL